MNRPRIAVIGGGVTGLAAAYELRKDAQVTLFEAAGRLGGKVVTEELEGILIEAGPDSLLARDEEPVRLLDELGLGPDIVEPHSFGAWIALDGTLKRLPEGFVLGIPASPLAVLRSGLLSPGGVARAAGDLVLPRTKIHDDESLGRVVRARFGDEVADRIVAPLMSGVRSGDIDEMSLDLAAPQIASVARSRRSLTLGLSKARRSAPRPRFIGLRRGMASLVDALRDASGAEILLDAPVGTMRDDLTIDGRPFDGAVVAVPPRAASSILAIPSLSEVRFADATVVNLVYPPGSIRPPAEGTGILVPPGLGGSLIACTWFTNKWPHLKPADGRTVVRCFARAGATPEAVAGELSRLMGTAAEPVAARVHGWTAALPEFRVGHRRLVADATAAIKGRPIRIAGAGFLATGLNDCLAHGRAAAREVLASARA